MYKVGGKYQYQVYYFIFIDESEVFYRIWEGITSMIVWKMFKKKIKLIQFTTKSNDHNSSMKAINSHQIQLHMDDQKRGKGKTFNNWNHKDQLFLNSLIWKVKRKKKNKWSLNSDEFEKWQSPRKMTISKKFCTQKGIEKKKNQFKRK